MEVMNSKIILKRDELTKELNDISNNIRSLLLERFKKLHIEKYSLVIDREYFKKAYEAIAKYDEKFQHEISKSGNSYEAMIQCTGHITADSSNNCKNFVKLAKQVFNDLKARVQKDFKCELSFADYSRNKEIGFDFYTSKEKAKELWESYAKKTISIKESASTESSSLLKSTLDEFFEQLSSLSNEQKKNKLNIIANLFSKESNIGKKINIRINANGNGAVSFNHPKIGKDFIVRFFEGRETFNGLFNSQKDINIDISQDLLTTAKSPKDILNFFNEIARHVDQIDSYEKIIFVGINKLDGLNKRILLHTGMIATLVFLFSMFTLFTGVDLSEKHCLGLDKKHMRSAIDFICKIIKVRGDKSLMTDIMKWFETDEVIKSLSNNISFKAFKVALVDFYNGKYDDDIQRLDDMRVHECTEARRIGAKNNVYYEAFNVKKLKKLPRDIVTYITIETENITTNNDKMMIASYCVSKLEICEWYIALLNTNSKKFIVPHDKPYLDWMRTELLRCYKNIMNTKVVNPARRPIIDIQYPSGYEG